MTGLVLSKIGKRFGAFRAVDDVSLEVPDGSFVCLLGPSGCGKTTLLRIIAGLEEADQGAVLIGGRDVTATPAHRREIGMVFQSLALFPHLSVADNVAYPLAIRSESKTRRRARAAELLELVQLDGLGERSISQLSGGQRQRVAIARALSLEPKIFLLDEPLSALDAKLREAMQVELRQLQQRLGVTTVVVTHDQREAMTMADLVVVMGEGRVRQAAAPMEVYRRPADRFVADFIGATNLLELREGAALGWRPEGLPPEARALSIRPEDVRMVAPEQGALRGAISFIRDLGAHMEIFVEVAGQTLIVAAPPGTHPDLAAGQQVGLSFDPARWTALAA